MFDLIIPCYNPPASWEINLLNNLKKLEEILAEQYNIIVVNDGSTINFSAKEENYLIESGRNIHIIRNKQNRGKGYSIRRAATLSSSEFCIYTDLDFPFGTDSVVSVLKGLRQGADIVIGTREKTEYYKKTSLFRKVVSKSLMWANKSLLRLPFEDTQAGIKGFNKAGKQIFLTTSTDRFLFDLEFLKLAVSYPDIRIKNIAVKNSESIHLSSFNIVIVFQESLNFIKILMD